MGASQREKGQRIERVHHSEVTELLFKKRMMGRGGGGGEDGGEANA